MLEKEIRLGSAGAGTWMREMVSTTDQLGIGCANIMA